MNKRGIEWDEILLWTIAVLSLALILAGIILYKRGGESLIEKLINLLRFRA